MFYDIGKTFCSDSRKCWRNNSHDTCNFPISLKTLSTVTCHASIERNVSVFDEEIKLKTQFFRVVSHFHEFYLNVFWKKKDKVLVLQ